MNTNKLISMLTGALVFFLACAAFVLSYDALYRLALDNGITPALAWLWPLTLDAVMIAASLSVLRNSLQGERSWYAWALVAIFTAASVTFNTLHAPDTWLARAVFALPPAVVFLSFELLTSQVKSELKRAGMSRTLRAMQDAVALAQTELADLSRQADHLSAQRDALQAEIDALKKERRVVKRGALSANDTADGITAGGFVPGDLAALALANDARTAQKLNRQEQLVAILSVTPGMTFEQLAQATGASVATVKRDVAELKELGRVKRNGRGLEVIRNDATPAVSQ